MARGTWGGATDRHPFKVNIKWQNGTDTAQTGFHLRATGLTVGSASEVATDVADFVTTSFRTILPQGVRVLGVDVVDMVTREGSSNSPASQMGTFPDNPTLRSPSFLAVTASLKGELRTRYGQGRMFFPVLNEAYAQGNSLSDEGSGAIQGVVTALVNRYLGGLFAGYTLINVHGTIPPKAANGSSPARPEVPPSWYDVTSVRLNPALTALRSRKAGVGS